MLGADRRLTTRLRTNPNRVNTANLLPKDQIREQVVPIVSHMLYVKHEG